MNQPPDLPVELSGQENSSLRDYISSHHTTVLTVMFTDIKGYTELTESRGEAYVDAIRKAHDKLLTGIIEARQAGLVIKHIGDAVMAVFADPSLAVDRAVQIQQQLVHFNRDNPQWDDIEIRIGLHMGQVTVEGELTFDIFGRHVNRAARLESLADGGQVYMSYTVFDSARSWLSHHQHFGWQSHGRYQLKGISEPVEVFEVWDKNLRQPAAPRKGQPVRQRPKLIYLAVAVIVGIALTLGINSFKATSVRLKPPYPDPLYTRQWQKIPLEGHASDPERRATFSFSAGETPLFYLISESTVRYSQVRLQRGDNLIQPDYRNYKLPAFYLRSAATATTEEHSRHQRWQYQAVNREGLLQHYETDALLTVTSTLDNGQAQHNIRWELKPVSAGYEGVIRGEKNLQHMPEQTASERAEEVIATFGRQKLLLETSLIRHYLQVRLTLEYR